MDQSKELFEELKSKIIRIENKTLLEKEYYKSLSICLKSGQFDSFRKLFNASVDFNLFLDIRQIPNRFSIISKLLLQCTEKVSIGYQTSAMGEIIDILKFCNEYSLFDKDLSGIERQELVVLKKDKLLMENLNDLFGRVSDSFILYIYKVMPYDLYVYFLRTPISYFPDRDGFMDFIKNSFFNQYTIYGLSVRNLSPEDNSREGEKISPLKRFFEDFDDKLKDNKEDISNLISIDSNYNYQIFFYDTEEEYQQIIKKKHLVSPKNLLKNKSKILAKDNYKFYSLSMVLLGGLGPQGLGFTYSTPRGEVIEICSDIKQNKAILIKFKKFLKTQFIGKLGMEMKNLKIKESTIKKVIKYLTDVLDKKDFINYFKKEQILCNIESFLHEDNRNINFSGNNLKKLGNSISNAIHTILRPIRMIDQYKARIDLVVRGMLKSEDIPKLTSLKGKSHYDVLRERFFFQYIVNWLYEIYIKEVSKGIK